MSSDTDNETVITKGRYLKRTVQNLTNGVVIKAVPLGVSKGRCWRAYRGDVLVGEFRTWQLSVSDPESTTGYTSKMVKRSWVESDEDTEAPHPERGVYGPDGWKAAVKALPDPLLRKISA